MNDRLNSLAVYLNKIGQNNFSDAVVRLVEIHKLAEENVGLNDFHLYDIDDPDLKAWDNLLLSIRQPSELVFEIKGIGKALTGSTDELTASFDKLNVPVDNEQKKELIQSLAAASGNKVIKTANWKSLFTDGNASKIKPGYFGRAAPIAGAFISVGTASKNITEAINNAKTIVKKLPLQKYNLSALKIFSPAAVTIGSTLSEQIDNHKDNPENLSELLDICKVISAFYMDFVFALSNSLMSVIDILTALSTLIDGPLPVADIIAGVIGFALSMGLIGAEFLSEYLSEKYWTNHFDRIKDIAIENIKRIEQNYPNPSTTI
jgi:hypothetical protein